MARGSAAAAASTGSSHASQGRPRPLHRCTDRSQDCTGSCSSRGRSTRRCTLVERARAAAEEGTATVVDLGTAAAAVGVETVKEVAGVQAAAMAPLAAAKANTHIQREKNWGR